MKHKKPAIQDYGVQLWTVRELLKEDFSGTIRKIADLGYKQIEFGGGLYGRSPEEIRELLDSCGLVAVANHISLDALRNDLEGVIKQTADLGAGWVILPWLPEDERRPIGKYHELAKLLNKAGRACKENGLGFAYHNHNFEFQPQGGVVPMDILFKETDAEIVKMELDVYWAVKGGANPADIMKENPGRFVFCHLKDMDSTAEKGFADVGQGIMQWPPLLQVSWDAGIRYYIVEHDEPRDAIASLKNSLGFLQKINF